MSPLIMGYPAMSAEQATVHYGNVFTLLDAVPCDLPEHRYSLTDESEDEAICSVPIRIGKADGFLNFHTMEQ